MGVRCPKCGALTFGLTCICAMLREEREHRRRRGVCPWCRRRHRWGVDAQVCELVRKTGVWN